MSTEVATVTEEFDFDQIVSKGSAFQAIVDANPELGVNVAAGTFTPYIKFVSGKAKLASRKKFPPEHYGLWLTPGKEEPDVDLGETFDAKFLSRRITAVMEVGEKYCRYYDPTTEEYKMAKAKADAPGMNGAFHGYEWLLWLPNQDIIATYHFNSVSTRALEEATWNLGVVGKTLSFGWRSASNTKGDWTTPVINFSSVSYKPRAEDKDKFVNTVKLFDNPVSSGPMLAAPAGDMPQTVDR